MMSSRIRIMEVCGTHTATIVRSGIRKTLPPHIQLVSGPGCPVCVTAEGYIDRLCALGEEGKTIVTFGDMIRVPGESGSLADFKARGGRVHMVYSPMEVIDLAKAHKQMEFVFAAVGFETIAPIYAMLVERLIAEGIENVKLLFALKTIAPAIRLMAGEVNGFIGPGHVAAITGMEEFEALAQELQRPICIAGFTAAAVAEAISDIQKQIKEGSCEAHNLYPQVVRARGNEKALSLMEKYFYADTALWRGIGEIERSGLYLRKEYMRFDAMDGSRCKESGKSGCRCGEVLCGKILPTDCAMFGKGCNPMTPKGPCMVSGEGACGIWYQWGGREV